MNVFAWLLQQLRPREPPQVYGPEYRLPADRSDVWPELKSAWIRVETRPGFCAELIEHGFAVEKSGLLHHWTFDWCRRHPPARSTRQLSIDDIAALEDLIRPNDFEAVR